MKTRKKARQKHRNTAVTKCQTSCLIKDEIRNIIQNNGQIPPGVVCNNTACRHNFYYDEVVNDPIFKFNPDAQYKRKNTPMSRKYRNCMCLLDRPLTLDQVAALYGATHQGVDFNLQRIMLKVKKMILESKEFYEQYVQ